jgi:Nif11 domain
MSSEAARLFRDKVAQSTNLQGILRTACFLGEDLDLVALGREHGFEFTRRECLQMWARLAAEGELSDFDIELLAKVKYYPDDNGFDWVHRRLAENSPAVDPIEVAVNHEALAIAVITAPRTPPTLESTLVGLREGGFTQTIHVFAEPNSLPDGWCFPGVQFHQNSERLGLYPNWLNAARWLLSHTDRPYLLLCEDDVEFCTAAAAGLWHGLTTLARIGYISLYTPVRSVELADIPIRPGWAKLNLGRLNWGALVYAFPRHVLAKIVRCEEEPEREATDSYVAEHIRRLKLICWHHLPSLARHTGDLNSSVGHPGRLGYSAIGYDRKYCGLRARSVK